MLPIADRAVDLMTTTISQWWWAEIICLEICNNCIVLWKCLWFIGDKVTDPTRSLCHLLPSFMMKEHSCLLVIVMSFFPSHLSLYCPWVLSMNPSLKGIGQKSIQWLIHELHACRIRHQYSCSCLLNPISSFSPILPSCPVSLMGLASSFDFAFIWACPCDLFMDLPSTSVGCLLHDKGSFKPGNLDYKGHNVQTSEIPKTKFTKVRG